MKEMFFELFLKPLKDKNYPQLFDIIFWAFVIIAPSFSYIFLYRRELFNDMDIIKLMILCIVLNIVFLMGNYFVCYIVSSYKGFIISKEAEIKLKEKCADEDTSKEEAEKEVDKYKKDRRSKVENDIVNEMRNNVIILTLVIWFSYGFTAIIRNVAIKKDIILVSMFVVWEGIYIFDYRRRALKELHNQEIDEEKIRDYKKVLIVMIFILVLVGWGVILSV